jgi:predicted dehydrogenase
MPNRTPSPSRRRFLLGAAGAAAALTCPVTRKVLGANESVNMGFIGLGGRGADSARWFSEVSGVRVASLCDPDKTRVGQVQNAKDAKTGEKKYPDAVGIEDLRRVLDDKNIDAVCISTCNHWHALAAIWAMQAGKDVYCEKPVSQTVWEGRKMVEAARKYDKICQGGTQQRSDPVQTQIKDFIKSGKMGPMQWIRGNRFGVRTSIGKRDTPMAVPPEINYDLWLGPAQDLPIYRKNFHYDWHWVWNTGSGEMGNWGVHIIDDIRNILFDKSTLPNRILAGGGRLAWNDAGESPNVHFVYFDTGIVPVIFSLSNLPTQRPQNQVSDEDYAKLPALAYRGTRSGYVIQFEDGYYAGGRGGGWAHDNAGKRVQQFKGDGGGAHAKNFINALRSRKREEQNAEIEQTHYTSAWCHLANIAYRLGKNYEPGQAEQSAKDFKPWGELLDQFNKHLDANGVDPKDPNLKLSGFLEIDPQKETFVGPSATPEALALLTREYRKGYEVPEKV